MELRVLPNLVPLGCSTNEFRRCSQLSVVTAVCSHCVTRVLLLAAPRVTNDALPTSVRRGSHVLGEKATDEKANAGLKGL